MQKGHFRKQQRNNKTQTEEGIFRSEGIFGNQVSIFTYYLCKKIHKILCRQFWQGTFVGPKTVQDLAGALQAGLGRHELVIQGLMKEKIFPISFLKFFFKIRYVLVIYVILAFSIFFLKIWDISKLTHGTLRQVGLACSLSFSVNKIKGQKNK